MIARRRLPSRDNAKSDISNYMALSAAELDALISDLRRRHAELSREYSEIADEERKEEIADTIGVIDGELASLEEQRQTLAKSSARTMKAG